jgi:hypothetical protein
VSRVSAEVSGPVSATGSARVSGVSAMLGTVGSSPWAGVDTQPQGPLPLANCRAASMISASSR